MPRTAVTTSIAVDSFTLAGSGQILSKLDAAIARLTDLRAKFGRTDNRNAISASVQEISANAGQLEDLNGDDPAVIAKRRHLQALGAGFASTLRYIRLLAQQLASTEEGFKSLRRRLHHAIARLEANVTRFGEDHDTRSGMATELAQIKTLAVELLEIDPSLTSNVMTLTVQCDAMLRSLGSSLEPVEQPEAEPRTANRIKEHAYRALEDLQVKVMCLGTSTGEGLTLRRPVTAKVSALMSEVSSPFGPLNDPATFVAKVRSIVSDVEQLPNARDRVTGQPNYPEMSAVLPMIRAQVEAVVQIVNGGPTPAQRTIIPVVSSLQVRGDIVRAAQWGE